MSRTYDFRDFAHWEIYHGHLAAWLSTCNQLFNVYHIGQHGMDGLRCFYWEMVE